MNLNRIISEEINRFLKEDIFGEKESKEPKNDKKKEPKKSKGKEPKNKTWKYGVDKVNYNDFEPNNNYEQTAVKAKLKGNIASKGAEEKLCNAITQDGVNTTEVCREAGYENPNNKASAVDKVAHHKKWGNGSTAHLRDKDIERLTSAAESMGIDV